MKYFVLVLFMLFTYASADDIQRVNSMVQSIKKLRNDYDNVVKELKICKLKLKQQQEKHINVKAIRKTKASSFRLNKDAIIYDNVDGKKILNWDKKTSFTSNIRTDKWIKITGYFVDRIWKKSKKNMWIKTSDTTLRE